MALCQFQPVKAAVQTNLDRIEARFRLLGSEPAPPDLLVYPEASLSGYILEGGVSECSLTGEALHSELVLRHARAGAPPVDLCLGFYEQTESGFCNSALWVSLGGEGAGLQQIHRKVFLPTYGLFDEERFTNAGDRVEAFDTRLGRVAMLICEDLWHTPLAALAALDGAQLLVTPAAGPARGLQPMASLPGWPATQSRWEALTQTIAAEHGIWVAVTQPAGFESGKAFAGGSLLVAPDGTLAQRGALFEAEEVVGLVDLNELTRVRAGAPLLSDLRNKLPLIRSRLESIALESAVRRSEGSPGSASAGIRDQPLPPQSLPDLAVDAELTRKWLVAFLRDEFRKRGFERAVVALSGGLDSVVVTWLAAEAFGAEHVTALLLPCRDSHPDSLAHAHLTTRTLGVSERLVEITASVEAYATALSERPSPARLGNLMSRIRMAATFDASAELNALPLGTGNKSERLLGYFTWHGDDAPPINPIGDLYKTQVRALAAHLGVPDEIIAKPPSADLIAGQTDEGDLGISYQRADPILELILSGYDDLRILQFGVTASELALLRGRLDRTHWKRRPPTVATVSGTAIGEFYLRPVDYQPER